MKVKTWVEFEQEVEVEVSIADMMGAITELDESDRQPMILDCISRCYGTLKRIPDAHIVGMNDKQREVIGNALREQAARYLSAASGSPQDARSDEKETKGVAMNESRAETAKQLFDRLWEFEYGHDPVERLRFFCSLAMNGQDWLDVEPFFAALADTQRSLEAPARSWPVTLKPGSDPADDIAAMGVAWQERSLEAPPNSIQGDSTASDSQSPEAAIQDRAEQVETAMRLAKDCASKLATPANWHVLRAHLEGMTK